MTHSGSRGVGGTIAQEYTRIAKSLHPELPKQYLELAWLSMDSDAGQEYWLAMNVAGDFAAACHRTIHKTVIAAAGLKVAAFVENHHNFAWEEEHQGETLIVHRKEDAIAPFGAAKVGAALISGARLIPIAGDNHWPMADDPTAPVMLRAITDFLDGD